MQGEALFAQPRIDIGDDSNEANQIVLVLLSANCRFIAFAMGGALFAVAETANGRGAD